MIKGEGMYKLFWNGNRSTQDGVGIMARSDWIKNVIQVMRISTREIVVVMTTENEITAIMPVYAPQWGCSAEENLSRKCLKFMENMCF